MKNKYKRLVLLLGCVFAFTQSTPWLCSKSKESSDKYAGLSQDEIMQLKQEKKAKKKKKKLRKKRRDAKRKKKILNALLSVPALVTTILTNPSVQEAIKVLDSYLRSFKSITQSGPKHGEADECYALFLSICELYVRMGKTHPTSPHLKTLVSLSPIKQRRHVEDLIVAGKNEILVGELCAAVSALMPKQLALHFDALCDKDPALEVEKILAGHVRKIGKARARE